MPQRGESALVIPPNFTTTWKIDPAHATAEFKVKHMMIAHVKGQFSKVAGKINRNGLRAFIGGRHNADKSQVVR
jgi:polyisoprenoid-binding protein YceI